MLFKKFCVIIVCFMMLLSLEVSVKADGKEKSACQTALPADTVAVDDMLSEVTAESFAVTEVFTGKILFEKNADEQRSISHLAKLMTLLITAEKLQTGEIALGDKATVSKYANSMNGSQIWLDVGEKITVEELIKSITVGNANDACVALAEKIADSEEEFVSLMNQRAKDLGMNSTNFADCTGISEATVSTARDMSILCGELSRHENLKSYMTTWIDMVRDGKAELVNLNRLVRSYKGITGMKACASQASGNCICASATRNDMSVCAVVLGSTDDEMRDKDAKKLLDMSFQYYEIFTPQIPAELLENIKILGGEVLEQEVKAEKAPVAVIPRGTAGSMEIITEREESIDAPAKKGDKVGSFTCKLGEDIITQIDITLKKDVKKMNVKCGLAKLLYNLLNF